MARITMRNVQKSPVEQYFSLFLSSAAARGVKDKTLQTYKQHFHSISKRMDVTVPMDCLNASDLDNMILKMREEGLPVCAVSQRGWFYAHRICQQTAGRSRHLSVAANWKNRAGDRYGMRHSRCKLFY